MRPGPDGITVTGLLGTTEQDSEVISLFMLSYHDARADRMTRDEAFNSARGFMLQMSGQRFGTREHIRRLIDTVIDERMLP